jgi:iron complex outermembrane receptor protein
MKKILCSIILLFGAQSDSTNYEDFFENSLEDFLQIQVTTASKSGDKLSHAPAKIYVLTKEKIQLRGYHSLSDLLESIPGVEIQRKSNAETFHAYSIRGIPGIEKFIIMQNGIRISSRLGISSSS